MSDSSKKQGVLVETITERDLNVPTKKTSPDTKKPDVQLAWKFISPSDANMSPCTEKLLKKGRPRGSGVPRTLIGNRVPGDMGHMPQSTLPISQLATSSSSDDK